MADIPSNHQIPRAVLAVCVAYESGFGDGIQSLDKKCPYVPGSDEYHAWMYGTEQGAKRAYETKADDPLLRESAERFHSTYCPTCPDDPCSLGIALRTDPEPSDELTVRFPRAWAPYLQAVILGALGDFDNDGDCRWHLNELQKFLGRASEKTSCEDEPPGYPARKQP